MGRTTYETIVPWWDTVAEGGTPDDAPAITAADREFAALQKSMTKVVFSTTLRPSADRVVLGGDIAKELAALKQRDGKDILLSCGPATLAPLANAAGLVDEYLLVVNPAVLRAGPRVFDGVDRDLALRRVDSKIFDAGAVVLRYQVVPS